MSIERYYYAESDLTFGGACEECNEFTPDIATADGYDIMDRQTGVRVAWCELFAQAIVVTEALNR